MTSGARGPRTLDFNSVYRAVWGQNAIGGASFLADLGPPKDLLGLGAAVLDGVADPKLVRRAREELHELEEAGEVRPSEDPCDLP